MKLPPRFPPFAATVRMFVGEGHQALEAELAQKLLASPLSSSPAEAAAAMGAHGLYELLVPKAFGGRDVGGTGRVDVRALCVARELLGYVSPMADSIFAVQGLGSHALFLSGAASPAFAEGVRSGARIGAFALTEPEAGSDVGSMRATARKDGVTWVLDGEKIYISNVGIAHHYVVFANADPSAGKKGISCFLVPADAQGVENHAVPMSGGHPLGRIVLRGVRVPEAAMVGELGHGLRLALGTLDVFRTSVGAAACGMARRALDETVRRVTTRVQFGKPLAEQQLVQAALAEMATELDAARLLVYRAAAAKDRGERASTEVAMAKMYATEAAQRIIDRAVQLHGGSGVVLGSVVEELYREIRPLRIYEGTTEIQQLIIGGALVAAAATGA